MSEQIDKGTPKMGRLIRVKNTKRPKFTNAKTEYYAMWVEDDDGTNERCLIFTEAEIASAEKRSLRNKEDWTKRDWVTDLLD